MKLKNIWLTLGILCTVTWIAATPYISINAMYRAARQQNAAEFSKYINYTKLKENLKTSIHESISKELSKAPTPDKSMITASTLATTLIDPIIDKMVTPENVALIMSGKHINIKQTEDNSDSNIQNDHMVKSMYYKDLNTFTVTIDNPKNSEKPIELIFSRTNMISWQLTSLNLIF